MSVEVEGYVPSAGKVEVEPATPGTFASTRISTRVFLTYTRVHSTCLFLIDDWEILQLHAEFVEDQLLRQACVVYPQMLLPIWVQQVLVIATSADNVETLIFLLGVYYLQNSVLIHLRVTTSFER